MRGFTTGKLTVYLRRPIQVWWGNHKLLELPVGI